MSAPILLSEIKGLSEAIAAAQREEEGNRDAAYIGLPELVAGMEVKPFTLRHLLICLAARSPFFTGEDIAPEDVAAFLWIVSPSFSSTDKDAREAFLAKASELSYLDARKGIIDYISRAMMDRPAGGATCTPVTSFVTPLIHRFCSTYGWAVDQVLDEPLAVLYQQLRMIMRDADPRRPFPNRLSTKAMQDFLNASDELY